MQIAGAKGVHCRGKPGANPRLTLLSLLLGSVWGFVRCDHARRATLTSTGSISLYRTSARKGANGDATRSVTEGSREAPSVLRSPAIEAFDRKKFRT